MTDTELINECLNNNPKAQKYLYDKFSPKMYNLCLRYARNTLEAEDILQDGFIKVFTNLKDKNLEAGSLEGWIRRIITNAAINQYIKNKPENFVPIDECKLNVYPSDIAETLNIIQKLPDGYRQVFNLYAIEGYDHKEIAQMLHISEGTSKSQLHRARIKLQKNLVGQEIICIFVLLILKRQIMETIPMPKYKITDEVYFMHNNKMYHGKVSQISIVISSTWGAQLHNHQSDVSLRYNRKYKIAFVHFTNVEETDWMFESQLFKTKDALIDHIIQ